MCTEGGDLLRKREENKTSRQKLKLDGTIQLMENKMMYCLYREWTFFLQEKKILKMSSNLILLKIWKKNVFIYLLILKNIFFCCQITKRSASYCIINNFEMNVFFYAECLNRQEAQQKKTCNIYFKLYK